MINEAFVHVLAASREDRLNLFTSAAQRRGLSERNVEKDFWVCWTLDALFNRLPSGRPRLLFKGGTSLSKAFDLIARFSEDIDVTVFRDDIGQAVSVKELEAMSGKKRQARLDAIRDACREYVNGPLQTDLAAVAEATSIKAGLAADSIRIVRDDGDPDLQTLLLWYPSVTADAAGYVRPAVRIESGAKSAVNPHAAVTVIPYVADLLDGADLAVPNVITIDPGRTFWDKAIILHGLRRWFDKRGELRQEGARISRHYYDVHQVLMSDVGRAAANDIDMAIDCARHAHMFFDRPDFDLASAVAGRFMLTPAPDMVDALRRDYASMVGMIFGVAPDFDAVLQSVVDLQERISTAAAQAAQLPLPDGSVH